MPLAGASYAHAVPMYNLLILATPLDVSLVPYTTHERRGSGDVWLISQASLPLITFWREFSLCQSHCRKNDL